ncbi:MAG: hypothetical protein QXI01_05735 [Nitrososphaerota archaeon]
MDDRESKSDSKRCIDPRLVIEDIIGEYGKVMEEYGGYRVEVLDHMMFPWANVFKLLLRLGHEVWVDIDGEKLIIISKPKPD